MKKASRTVPVILLAVALGIAAEESAMVSAPDSTKIDSAVAAPAVQPAAVSVPPVSEAFKEERARMDRKAALGRDLYHTATIGTLVSSGALAVGILARQPPLLMLGALGFYLGIPAVGVGSGMKACAARFGHPDAKIRSGKLGWTLYALGLAAVASGTAWIYSNLEVTQDSTGLDVAEFKDSSAVAYASMVVLGGIAMDLAAWYQFSRRHREADALARLRVEPVLYLAGKRRGAGLRLAMNF